MDVPCWKALVQFSIRNKYRKLVVKNVKMQEEVRRLLETVRKQGKPN